jgi:hypothetical protein
MPVEGILVARPRKEGLLGGLGIVQEVLPIKERNSHDFGRMKELLQPSCRSPRGLGCWKKVVMGLCGSQQLKRRTTTILREVMS